MDASSRVLRAGQGCLLNFRDHLWMSGYWKANCYRVLGAGYPSLATMTVNDWYEQRMKQAILPDKGIPQTTAADPAEEELQKEQQEKKVEEDDEETLQKARDLDDWKDTHPRGYGNRQNMG